MTSAARAISSVIGLGIPGRIESSFGEDLGDGGADLVSWFGAGGEDLDSSVGVMVEQDPGGGAAPRVVDAQEQDDGLVFHDGSLVWPSARRRERTKRLTKMGR